MFRALTVLIFVIASATAWGTNAQQGGTTAYVYDDSGRLRAVVSPAGEANIYDYDAAGNFTAIRRVTANTLELFSFSPHQGVPGDLVTIRGIGFGAGVSAVSFNGAAAQIVSTSVTTIIVTVPVGATTGPIAVTTAAGTVNTTAPFVIKGVQLIPTSALLSPGESRQFTATVFLLGSDLSVHWSVNGIEGGNQFVGTITTTGLYTAPNLPSSSIVRATSVADPSLFAEAPITMVTINNVFGPISTGVSVRRETDANPTPTPTVSAISAGVAVKKESDAIPTPTLTVSAISVGVAVKKEADATPPTPTASAISVAVAVRRGTETAVSSNLLTPFSNGVSAMTGPYISSITPNQLSRGAAVTITVSGAHLNGAATIVFLDNTGAIDANTVASNIVVNPAGTSLTATVSVAANAATGLRIVLVSATAGQSLPSNLSVNTISIQ